MSAAPVTSALVPAPFAEGVCLDIFAVIRRDDRPLYATLPDAAKADLRNWIKWLAPVIKAGRRQRGLQHQLDAVARISGASAVTVRRKWDLWWQHDGWKGLVNRALAGPEWQERKDDAVSIARRPAFLDHVRLTAEENQRGTQAALKHVLLPRWKRWRATGDAKYAIPGYDSCPPAGFKLDRPAGWSLENLNRHMSSRFDLTAARIGRSAAANERPLLYTTRQGLWVGSHYMLDDMWHDFFVNTFAERQAGRPLELFSHDLFSARKIRWGVRVRVKGEDGKYKGLEERMTRLILAATLYLDGYSPRGTVIVAEHGTAAVSRAVETALVEISGGLITVSRSGMEGAAAHGGQYPGISRGNFRHKASLESSNNLTHNVFASLPGQTGKDVLHRPEQLGALLKENETLLRAYDRLAPEQAALLEFPLLELGAFHGVAHALYGQIEDDPDHGLTDWEACGHLVQQVWVDDGWRDLPDMATMAPDVRSRLADELDAGRVPTRLRKMTRREVWDRGAGELVKLPGHGVWDILQSDLAAPRTVAANELAFEDAEIAPGKLRFWTRGVDAFGREIELADRQAYKVVVNPFAPDTAFVGDLAGRYIGEFPAVLRPTRSTQANDPALLAAMGAVAKRETELLAPLRARHAGAAAAKEARQRHNKEIISGPSPAQKAAAASPLTDAWSGRRVTPFLSVGSPRKDEQPNVAADRQEPALSIPVPESEQPEGEDLGPLW